MLYLPEVRNEGYAEFSFVSLDLSLHSVSCTVYRELGYLQALCSPDPRCVGIKVIFTLLVINLISILNCIIHNWAKLNSTNDLIYVISLIHSLALIYKVH